MILSVTFQLQQAPIAIKLILPMTADHTFYRDLAYVFGAALAGGAIARALKQPMILGYVLGGILVGPFTPGLQISNVHEFESLAEIGVILLMYTIGLEFSFDDLLQVKWVATIGAPLGILLSVVLGLFLAWLLNWNWQQGVALGAIVSVASTMVLSRLLNDQRPLVFEDGRQQRDFVHVADVADAFLTALESDAPIWDVFNVGSGTPITISEMAATLARALGKQIAPEYLDKYRVGDVRHCFADVSKIERVLGFTPRRSFEAGMEELIAWVAQAKAPVDRSASSMAELERRKLLV